MTRWLLAVLVLVAGAALVSAQGLWFPLTVEIARHAYMPIGGASPVPRYQLRYLRDQAAPVTCLVVLTDEDTGRFSVTAVPAESCEVRR